MRKAALGEEEGLILKWVAEHDPSSVGEVARALGESRGLARTTVLTVMERLRGKGFLEREKVGGVFRYSPSEPHTAQMRGLVSRFVERSLGGSLDPFVAYLSEEATLSEEQIASLGRLVRDLEARSESAPRGRDSASNSGENIEEGA